MKRSLLILFLLGPLLSHAQSRKPIDGFLGIKFGSDIQTVKTTLLTKGAKFLADSSDAEYAVFKHITIGSRKNAFIVAKFINGKVYEADIAFEDQPKDRPIEFYNNLVKDINETYGVGQVHKDFKLPYNDGDGKEIEAIKTGNATYITVWADESNQSGIEVTIDTSLNVYLVIQNGPMRDEAAANQK